MSLMDRLSGAFWRWIMRHGKHVYVGGTYNTDKYMFGPFAVLSCDVLTELFVFGKVVEVW